ncbi:MAG: 3-oxo-5-alpha-steroid 4-dehydrogenase [Chitinophagales bacterium]|nr:3-oxo-5-alpha-steroid 4-dehydrogenase [Chitinophagales bacterium]
MQYAWHSFTSSPSSYQLLTYIAFGLIVFTVFGALVMKTPYGRFSSAMKGFKFRSKTGWFLMELPALISFIYFYLRGSDAYEAVSLFLLTVWIMHYGYRGILFPLRMIDHSGKRSFHFSVVLIGMIVTSLHGYLNALWITEYASFITNDYLLSAPFIIGLTIYLFGFYNIVRSDSILRKLRLDNISDKRRYFIPYGGLFNYVSSAQYLSELIAWSGFMILTMSPGGVFIFLISAANLIPRSISTHRWYQESFPDYPKSRKVLIPGIF